MEGKSVWFGMTVTVHKTHVAQISQTEGGVIYLFIYYYYLLHLLAKIKQVRAGLLPCTFTYIPPILQRAQRSTASKKKKREKTQNPAAASPLSLK